MRDPTVRVDPVEAAIEQTVQFLKRQDLRPNQNQLSKKAAERLEAMWPHIDSFRPGRSRPSTSGRDAKIAIAVLSLCAKGFKPTRNREKHGKPGGESACAVVAHALCRLGVVQGEEALKKAETNTEKIWQKHKQFYPKKVLSVTTRFANSDDLFRTKKYRQSD
jgi:hypothetical protein